MKATLKFYECEHENDLSHYKDDIIASGGKIISSRLSDNEDSETGVIVFEIEDKAAFLVKFKVTDSYGFSNLA